MVRKDVDMLVDWAHAAEMAGKHFQDVAGLGLRTHGMPVRVQDRLMWVESYQWQLMPDGSREPVRYRVVRTDGVGGVEPFPFHRPGHVLEHRTEQDARDSLVVLARARGVDVD